jgi:hypothetical protein
MELSLTTRSMSGTTIIDWIGRIVYGIEAETLRDKMKGLIAQGAKSYGVLRRPIALGWVWTTSETPTGPESGDGTVDPYRVGRDGGRKLRAFRQNPCCAKA